MALMTMAFNFTYADNLTDGLTFANSIAPSALGQVVNPSAVNATAWSSNGASTSVPIATPIGLGTFSAPTTSSTIMSPSNPIGVLSNLGNQAITDCETYVPTGNPMLDQRCAAVNFMSNKCVTPTNTQNAVLGAAGTSVASSAACAGTYGQGAANFGFNNQITSSDNIFTAVNSAQTNATANTQSNCSTQQVVTKPAEYSNNQCVKSSNAQINKCNKVLNVTVTQTCTQQWVETTMSPPLGPFGQVVSTYDDFRNGAGDMCATIIQGSQAVSASCYPADSYTYDIDGNVTGIISSHPAALGSACDIRHNGSWYQSSVCPDQQWCNGAGVQSLTCKTQQLVCTNIPAISWDDQCAPLEAKGP